MYKPELRARGLMGTRLAVAAVSIDDGSAASRTCPHSALSLGEGGFLR